MGGLLKMVNLTPLENITPLVLNTTIVEDIDQIIPNLINNTNTQTDNWYGLLVMLILFFYMTWRLTDESGKFRLDIVKGIVYSSGITVIVGAVMLVTNITTTYNHVVWFAIVFTLAMISAWYLKSSG